MTVLAQFSQRATCPPSAIVRQRSMADITFIWSRLTCPALALRHAAPWSRKISATSNAGRDTAPTATPAPQQPWADLPKVVELAKRKNAVIKITGACTLSKEPYPFPDIWDPLARIFDAWGFERCLWGTDWTRAFAVVNYEQGVEPFLKTDRLSDTERAMLMGGACAKAYGWSPKKA